MDHSFKDRVDKVFGSISSPSASSAPWSLTGAQVEKRVWNRDKGDKRDVDDETLVSSSFDDLFNCRRNRRKGLDDLSDDDGQIGGDEAENDGDEWDIRSSIGLDSTLDNEEEEDAYDKMAEGRENDGDRVYMKDVTDHGPYLNSHNVLPSSVNDAKKDPRANHDAAKTRLKEDDDEPMINAAAGGSEDDIIGIKSILKRKSDGAVKAGAKRVRFDPTCKNDDSVQVEVENGQSSSLVPDYLINPSKYTRYDFYDVNNGYMEQVKESKDVELEQKSCGGDVPRSPLFIPRKKRGEVEGDGVKQSSSTEPTPAIAIAALQQEEEEEEGESSEMMQDKSHVDAKKGRFQKPGRQYRSKLEEDD